MRLANGRFARALGASFVLAFALGASSGPVLAQTAPPGIDHYLVYRVQPGVPFGAVVALRDQFRPTFLTHDVFGMPLWANWVSKDGSQVSNTQLHYSWYSITPDGFRADVIVSNQFGDQTVHVFDSHYLLNPALKFPPAGQPLPIANHYKCYDADGPPPQPAPRTVNLQDQFGTRQAVVGNARYFCNPVDKQYQGQFHPMERPDAHFVCYQIFRQPPQPTNFPITFRDQFLSAQTTLVEEVLLCVPTIKHEVVATRPSTWGGVKAIYR